MQAPVEPHPVVDLTVSIDQSDYDHLRLPCPKMRPMKCSVVVDSGCQSVLLGLKMFNQFGLKKSCLVPVKGQMSAINGEDAHLEKQGNILNIFIRCTNAGWEIEANQRHGEIIVKDNIGD